jgi:hypothetical protein
MTNNEVPESEAQARSTRRNGRFSILGLFTALLGNSTRLGDSDPRFTARHWFGKDGER